MLRGGLKYIQQSCGPGPKFFENMRAREVREIGCKQMLLACGLKIFRLFSNIGFADRNNLDALVQKAMKHFSGIGKTIPIPVLVSHQRIGFIPKQIKYNSIKRDPLLLRTINNISNFPFGFITISRRNIAQGPPRRQGLAAC